MSILFGLNRVHQGDPLGSVIKSETRGEYTHVFIVKDPAKLLISEAYEPNVRWRVLRPDELAGIDFYRFKTPLTPSQVAGILAHCALAENAKESYSIGNLFRFSAEFRAIIGEAPDLTKLDELAAVHHPLICSQYVLDTVWFGARIMLQEAPDYAVAPVHIGWSALLEPMPAPVLANGVVTWPEPQYELPPIAYPPPADGPKEQTSTLTPGISAS